MAGAVSSLLVTLVRRGERASCVLLPGAGGGLNPYLRLASFLGQTRNVYAVRAAGLAPDETALDSVDAMATAALEALRGGDAAPDAVFGWSLGGAVAWELCVRLADEGRRPDLMLVDASPVPRRSTPGEDARLRETIVDMLGPRPDPATVERVRRVFDAQIAALARYRAQRPYPGRVLLLRCTDDAFPDRDAAMAQWATLAPDLRAGRLDAGHFAVFDPEWLPQLTGEIAPFLGRATEVGVG